jgi:hypothetical protein
LELITLVTPQGGGLLKDARPPCPKRRFVMVKFCGSNLVRPSRPIAKSPPSSL